jgi:hypothetical protein
MIYVTPRAAVEIRALLERPRAEAGHALRLALDGRSGIVMQLRAPTGNDAVLADAHGVLLAIAPELARRLDGLVFDWVVSEVQGLRHGGFSFRPQLGEEQPDLIALTAPPAPA